MEKLHRQFRQDPFVLLTIDVGEGEQKVKRFAKKNGLSFPILLDRDSAVAFKYGIRAHPVAYLIDTEGYIIGVAKGYRKWDRNEMKALIRSLGLAKKKLYRIRAQI